MESLKRNQTTAAEAMALEDGITHPMPIQDGKFRKSRYFFMLQARRELPVSQKREEFLTLYQSEQVLVVVGETGSGKSTQIPQFVFFDEWKSGLKIACTHPRRIAALSVARRVAEEMAVPLGEEVGYHVRFEAKMSKKTRLAYMTDEMLLAQAKNDLLFSVYSCIIIDEAHERTMATDILMALLKRAISIRKDLKVIVMSATLDAAKFQAYFGGAKLLEVPVAGSQSTYATSKERSHIMERLLCEL
ncbi:DEAH-box ATP-dependent RNA helicase prp43 [Fusarium falciforme]